MAAETLGLTNEQREAVNHDGHLSLTSCPGSGKTRVTVAKMLLCVQTVAGTPRRIGCITYTNAGVNEIEDRLVLLASGDEVASCDVSTIHGFCLNQILRRFASRVPELRNGFEVLAPESEKFKEAVAEISKRHGLQRWLGDAFPSVQRRLDGSLFVPKGLPAAAARDFMALVSKPGLLTFGDIVYQSARLVTSDKEIARALSCRFAWILVDEFQDTTDLQASMLQSIASEGRTKLFMVGDPHQAIFGFAGARPELMATVAKEIGARTDVVLNGTQRCSGTIVATAERLLPRVPPMVAVGRTAKYPHQPKHVHAATPTVGVLGSFLPELKQLDIEFGATAILAPQWPILYHLARDLRDKGVPVIGPGARPYRRSLEFAQFAESACAYLEKPDSRGAVQVQRTLFQMLLLLTGDAVWEVFTFEGKKVLLRILAVADQERRANVSALHWLQNVSAAADHVLAEAEWMAPENRGKLQASAKAMEEAIRRNVQDADTLSVNDLAIFARPEKCIHLLTMHSAKGREFEAVALVGFQEGFIPHFSSKTAAEFDEARRLAYVAMTRPRKLLMVITDGSNDRNPHPSRYVEMSGL